MIPPKPRAEFDLTPRDLRVHAAPDPAVAAVVSILVLVTVHGGARDLSRCLNSVAGQEMDTASLGVVVLYDQVSGVPPTLALPPRLRARTWVVTANCGTAARARNTALDFAERIAPLGRWLARLDWDDRFATLVSLAAAVAVGEQARALFVLGGNRVLSRDGVPLRDNPVTEMLQDRVALLDLLRHMAEGRAENELPSCNLVLAAGAGCRYPDRTSAEDHWLVADLLFHHSERGALLTDPLFLDYTLDGVTTRAEKEARRHQAARAALYRAACTWDRVLRLPGSILGLGQEGIVRHHEGTVSKHFYPGVLRDEKAHWLETALTGSSLAPSPQFTLDPENGGWVATYPYEDTIPFTTPRLEAVRTFLHACLTERLLCGNCKQSNFRVRPDGSLSYIDIGDWIVPFDVSVLRDSAARLYAFGVLGWPDDELLRRRVDTTQPEVWERLPGFQTFLGEVIAAHGQRAFAAATRLAAPPPPRHPEVSLLIKACGMDATYARAQILHLVDQLVGPWDFAERVLLIDPHTGSFLRQHAAGKLELLFAIARELQEAGVLDRVLIAPTDDAMLRAVNRAWFAADCAGSHSTEGIPVAIQVWGFEQVRTQFVLQCDIDALVGRRDRHHDYLAEMLAACRVEDVVCVAFNIPKDPGSAPLPYAAPLGEFKPEVRCGLLDLRTLLALRPLPAKVEGGRLTTTWYRSLLEVQRQRGLRTLRGGDPATFYVHPPNTRKADMQSLGRIRDLVAQGQVPPSQWGRWDLETPDEEWSYPRRTEPVIVLARGRDTDEARLQRFAHGLAMQDDQSFGVVVIDDASTRIRPSVLREPLAFLGKRLTLVRHAEHRGRMRNNVFALRELCSAPESLIVFVDLDDTLMDSTALRRLGGLAANGHDVILAAPFRPDAPTRVYQPCFTRPRQTYGGDVWIHLRSFKRRLFDVVPDEALQLDGRWLEQCDDYAIMIPIVEASQRPIYLPEYLYWHERFTVFNEEGCRRRDELIEQILAKAPASSPSALHVSTLPAGTAGRAD